MKVATQRTFRAVHTWTGIIAGMALFIAFYAGAISVFVHELNSWQLQSELVQPDPLDRAQPLVEKVLAQYPEVADGFTLQLPGEHGPKVSVLQYDDLSDTWRKFQLGDNNELLTMPGKIDFVSFIYDLHFTAGLPRLAGLYLFGVFCVLYGLALVSGVVIYAPVFLKDLFALRLGPSVKRLWQDAHNVVGLLSLPFHIIFAWSGAVLTIGFLMLAPFQFTVFDGKLLDIIEPDLNVVPHVEPVGDQHVVQPVEAIIYAAKTAIPKLNVESLFYHDAEDTNGNVKVRGTIEGPTLFHSATVVVNSTSGELIASQTPTDASPGTTFLRGLQSLHYGSFGDYAIKWLYFILGMAGAFLFYSGNLLWIESRRRASSPQQSRSTRIMAGLTLGISLGCMAGISALFLVPTFLPQAWHISSYYGVFFAVLCWCMLRQPAKAAVEMLIFTAVLTACIPLASFIQSGEFFIISMLEGHWVRFGVDITALLMAYGFWRLAMAARKRAILGPKNSVWALSPATN